MERRIVLRGFAAGALGGVLAFIFARIFTEPVIQASINYESARDAVEDTIRKAAGLAPAAAGPDIYSRSFQESIGIGTGLLLFGAAMGGLFAVTYFVSYTRSEGRIRPRNLALLIAGGCFLVFFMVPFMKYPANPPAIGHPDTIRARGFLYLGMVGISAVSLLATVIGQRRLSSKFGNWNATLLAGLGFIVWIALVQAILPPLGHLHANVAEFGRHATETPLPLRNAHGTLVYPGFPADTLFKFRLYSVINQLILWGTIGLGFGALAERLHAESPAQVGDGVMSPNLA